MFPLPIDFRPLSPVRRLGATAGAERRRGAAALLALIAVLGGCASPASIRPGQTLDQVLAAHGRPQREHVLPDGRRLEYVQDGFQQDVFMVDVDGSGRVREVTMVRIEATFARIRPGIDDRAAIARLLGTPLQTYEFPRKGETAWLYPYRESGVWFSAMAVYFDARGIVTRTENGPDPRFVGGRGDRND